MERALVIAARIDRLLRFIGRSSSIFFLLLMGTILVDVLTRGQGWTNSTKLQELEWHFSAALCFLVFGYAMAQDRHVRVEVLREGWSFRVRAAVELLGLVLLFLPMLLVALYYSWFFVEASYLRGEASSSATGLGNRWIIKSFQLIGLGLLLLAGVSATIRNVAVLTGHRPMAEGLPVGLPDPSTPGV